MQLEAFAAERRERLTVADDALEPVVAEALAAYARGEADWNDPIVEMAGQLWLENYQAEAPGSPYLSSQRRFEAGLADVLDKTGEPSGDLTAQTQRITRWLSTYAVNAGTVQGAYRRGVRFKLWVSMEDDSVREAHQAVDGQVVPIGSTFTVGGTKMAYPGEPVGPIALWINCRCVIMPAAQTGETMSSNTFELQAGAFTVMQDTPGLDEELPDPEERSGALVVLLPAADDPIGAASSEDIVHMTTVWFGDTSEVPADFEELEQAVRLYAQDLDGPVVVPVKERGPLGDEGADVVFLEPTDSLLALRDGMLANEPIRMAHDAAEQFPQWTPHVTLGYPEGVEGGPAIAEYDGTEVTFDRIGLWLGGEKTEYPMGGTVSTITADAAADVVVDNLEPGIPAEDYEQDDELEDDEEPITEIPVHGVLAPEGLETGDGRGFREGSLSVRPLPLPLRLEILSSHGGNQTSEVVTVGRLDEVWREGTMMRYRGAIILAKEHAHEAIQGIIDGSGTGVSIDADAMAVDMEGFSDEIVAEASAKGKNPTTWFSETRVAGLTIVPIPAFVEQFIDLGHEFEEDMSDEDREAAEAALVACGCAPTLDEKLGFATGGTVARGTMPLVGDGGAPGYIVSEAAFAPGTKDGPGWITHPIPTSRIRRYWTKGEGAAKIRWGAPGDFTRCERQLRKYVQNPEWLAGLCANMHKEVNGYWPGDRRNRGRKGLIASGALPAPILTLIEAEEEERAITAGAAFPGGFPAEWFANPKFKTVTPLTIDKEAGRIYGHLAQWGVCHIGIAGDCVKPPHSRSGYANFLKGVVDTTEGEQSVGCLTYGIGHANPRMRASAATAHYDQPDAVVAYVNIGEDAYGIWYSGVLRPGIEDSLIDEFRALGAISGDWRPVGRYGLDLIASVAVNTPGYPVSIAASGGHVTALIAAGMVTQATPSTPETFADDNADYLASAIALAMEKRENKKREEAARKRALSLRQADTLRRIKKG